MTRGSGTLATRTESRNRGDSIARNRWMVHLALILGFLAAALSPIFLSRMYWGHSGTTNHAIISLIVLGIVLVHLWQRRHTVRRLFARLIGHQSSPAHRSFQAPSDLILWILTLNAVVSGVADYLVGHQIFLPVSGPIIFQKWHAMSALVLLVYVIVHVVRRRKRLRRSHIN